MKALRLHGAGDLRLEEVPSPRAAEGQVLVRILANGICGSDVHFYEDGKLGVFVVDRPYTPGHRDPGLPLASGTRRGDPRHHRARTSLHALRGVQDRPVQSLP